MSRKEQALRDYSLFTAGVLTGLGVFAGVGFAIVAAGIIFGLLGLGFIKELRSYLEP